MGFKFKVSASNEGFLDSVKKTLTGAKDLLKEKFDSLKAWYTKGASIIEKATKIDETANISILDNSQVSDYSAAIESFLRFFESIHKVSTWAGYDTMIAARDNALREAKAIASKYSFIAFSENEETKEHKFVISPPDLKSATIAEHGYNGLNGVKAMLTKYHQLSLKSNLTASAKLHDIHAKLTAYQQDPNDGASQDDSRKIVRMNADNELYRLMIAATYGAGALQAQIVKTILEISKICS